MMMMMTTTTTMGDGDGDGDGDGRCSAQIQSRLCVCNKRIQIQWTKVRYLSCKIIHSYCRAFYFHQMSIFTKFRKDQIALYFTLVNYQRCIGVDRVVV